MAENEEPSQEASAPALVDRLEVAPTGRAKCRACEQKIDKGALRFGEVLASGYGEGDGASTFWFHPRCAAQRRPEKFAALLRQPGNSTAETIPDREALLAEADLGLAHPRLARVAGAERSPSGRAHCRHCRELIPQGGWRIRLSSFGETGFFDPLGFLHAGCATAYFGTNALEARLRVASPGLDEATLAEAVASLV
jgi:Poly(ADP-ribose) polymerase and DNA-Ligase Zn-finger region